MLSETTFSKQKQLKRAHWTVWCSLLSKGMIGYYLIENCNGDPFTVNSEIMGVLVWKPTFFGLKLNNTAGRICGFNKIVTECHPSLGNANCPLRSCDFTLSDYFLLGYATPQVFTSRDIRLATIRIKVKFCTKRWLTPTLRHNMKIVFSDFNFRLYKEIIFSTTFGKFSLSTETSPNGLRVVNMKLSVVLDFSTKEYIELLGWTLIVKHKTRSILLW